MDFYERKQERGHAKPVATTSGHQVESLVTGAPKRDSRVDLPTPTPALHLAQGEEPIARECFGMVPAYVGASFNSNGVAFAASNDENALKTEMLRLADLGHQGTLLGRPKPGFFKTLAEQKAANPNLDTDDEPLLPFEALVEPLNEPAAAVAGMVFEGGAWESWGPETEPVVVPEVTPSLQPLDRYIREACSRTGSFGDRRRAIGELADCPELTAFEALVQIAKDQSRSAPGVVKAMAIDVLAKRQEKDLAFKVIEEIGSSFLGEYEPGMDHHVFKAVADALLQSGRPESEALLQHFLQSADPRHRAHTAMAMGQSPVWAPDRELGRYTTDQIWPGKDGQGFEIFSLHKSGHLNFIGSCASMEEAHAAYDRYRKGYLGAEAEDRQAAFEAAEERGDFE